MLMMLWPFLFIRSALEQKEVCAELASSGGGVHLKVFFLALVDDTIVLF